MFPTWIALKKGKDTFNKGSKWILRRDSGLSLWFDKWLDKGMLRSIILGLLNKGEENIKLNNIASYFGWNMENISFSFPTPILLEIKATPLPFSFQGEDRITWHYSSNGEFKLKEAYQLIVKKEEDLSRPSFPGAWVWKTSSLPKVKHFPWQCCQSSIGVRAILNERGLGIPPVCLVCNTEPKTIIHALRDCPKAQCFWNSFSPPILQSLFYGLPLVEWLKTNCRSSRHCGISDIEWGIMFPMVVWILWLHCNSIVFGRLSPQRNLLDETLARAEVAYLGINGKQAPI